MMQSRERMALQIENGMLFDEQWARASKD